jgi:hypothetical protein
MIICELSFNKPNPDNPKYSLHEVDFYSHIPFTSYQAMMLFGVPNHRLSLRKNLETGEFEVYRYYHIDKREEVVFSGTFEYALEFANNQERKFWGHIYDKEPDIPCQHKPPNIDITFCPKWSGRK